MPRFRVSQIQRRRPCSAPRPHGARSSNPKRSRVAPAGSGGGAIAAPDTETGAGGASIRRLSLATRARASRPRRRPLRACLSRRATPRPRTAGRDGGAASTQIGTALSSRAFDSVPKTLAPTAPTPTHTSTAVAPASGRTHHLSRGRPDDLEAPPLRPSTLRDPWTSLPASNSGSALDSRPSCLDLPRAMRSAAVPGRRSGLTAADPSSTSAMRRKNSSSAISAPLRTVA